MSQQRAPGDIRKRMSGGQVVLGVISNIPSPAVSEMLALAGFDLVLMDMEHGPMTFESLENCARATRLGGSIPFARVADNNPKLILRALDAGALGVMVPSVNTANQLTACITAARFAPTGTRGLAMTTYAARYGTRSLDEHLANSNQGIMVWPQIETVEAYENLDSLLNIPGVDAFIIGPSDLSQSLGYPGQTGHPRVQEVLRDIIKRCREAGAIVGTVSGTPERTAELAQLGVQIVLAGANGLLIGAGRSFINESRELIQGS